jgi:hypothetical protein
MTDSRLPVPSRCHGVPGGGVHLAEVQFALLKMEMLIKAVGAGSWVVSTASGRIRLGFMGTW